MSTPLIVVWILFFLLAPAGVIWLTRRWRPLARVGTILLMYILGLLAGNLLIYPFEGAAQTLFPIQDALSSITIPLAMPLILFACNFKDWPVRKALVALLCGIVAVTGMAVAAAGSARRRPPSREWPSACTPAPPRTSPPSR